MRMRNRYNRNVSKVVSGYYKYTALVLGWPPTVRTVSDNVRRHLVSLVSLVTVLPDLHCVFGVWRVDLRGEVRARRHTVSGLRGLVARAAPSL